MPAHVQSDLLPGTLRMLILIVLDNCGPRRGAAIGRAIHECSSRVLRIESGSLYPALKRLCAKRWVRTTDDCIDSVRGGRSYRITSDGRKQLLREHARWNDMTAAVNRAIDALKASSEAYPRAEQDVERLRISRRTSTHAT